MHFSMQPVNCQYKSKCTSLAILLFLQFFCCNLGPGTIYTDLGFPLRIIIIICSICPQVCVFALVYHLKNRETYLLKFHVVEIY